LDVPVGLADATDTTPETCIILGLQQEARQNASASGHLEITLDAILFLCDYILPN